MTARALLALAWVALLCGPSLARREPSVGGSVVVALPDDILAATIDAHVQVPLVERARQQGGREALAHPSLPGLPGWRSTVLSDVEHSDDHRRWTLTAFGPAGAIGASVKACFTERGSWPAEVIHATDLAVEIALARATISLTFDRPVGVVPELLEGCLLRGATGVYALTDARRLEAREGHVLGPPSLGRIELRTLGEPADLVAGSPIATGVGALLAPFPDVVLLIQPEAQRARDPLDLGEGEGPLAAFRSELRPDLLVTIFWAGRGGPALGVLPPGLAPARPLPEPTEPPPSPPLTLGALSSAAERLPIFHTDDDVLVEGVVERIAVLLRTRGFGTELTPQLRGSATGEGHMRVVRWRPPTDDPVLALLSLAGVHGDLKNVDQTALDDPRLLSASREDRLLAAMDLERRWMEARAVVPLLIADHWFAFDTDLRGVRIRPDGVPLLGEAHWGGNR